MRHGVLLAAMAAITATAVFAFGNGTAASAEDLVTKFIGLTRATAWEPVARVSVEFPTHHPQGFAAVGDALFVSSVEIIEPTERYPTPRDGYDRSPGKGRGHLFKMSRDGKLLGQTALGESDIYHPGGIDFDGRWLWVPVAEYRPDSRSIVYRIDPETLEAVEVMRARDHIGGIVRDTDANTLHGVSWGSRRFYTWHLDGELRPVDADRPLEELRTPNPSHYVDYQDCAYVGGHRSLCSGVSEHRPDPGKPKWSLGGLDLVDLMTGRPVHQVPVLLWTEGGEAMTRNPVLVEPTAGGLRVLFLPEDDRSTLYVYEARAG
jgi:hypothetical protein